MPGWFAGKSFVLRETSKQSSVIRARQSVRMPEKSREITPYQN